MPWQLGTSSQLQMIADDRVIAKIPWFSTVLTFDVRTLPQEDVNLQYCCDFQEQIQIKGSFFSISVSNSGFFKTIGNGLV